MFLSDRLCSICCSGEHPSGVRNNILYLPCCQHCIRVCLFDDSSRVGLEHSHFHSERGINISSHPLRTLSPCQPQRQMEAVGATPRAKERWNVIFISQKEYFFVSSVMWTGKFVLHTITVCVCCSLSHQLKNDPVMEKVCFQTCPGSLSWYHLFVALQSLIFWLIYSPLKKEEKKPLCFWTLSSKVYVSSVN